MEKPEPGRWETLDIAAAAVVLFLAIVWRHGGFAGLVANFLDNDQYLAAAHAIRNWDFHALTAVKPFWGLPYAIAGVSAVVRVSPLTALLLVAWTSSLAAVELSRRLWGGWVATWCALNWTWVVLSGIGGSEPLFFALLVGAFLAARKERWLVAAALAALSTTVRPVGAVALLAIAFGLARQRRWRALALATTVGASIGAAYFASVWLATGSPWANLRGYAAEDMPGQFALTYPFHQIVVRSIADFRWQGEHALPYAVRDVVRVGLWIAASAVAIARRRALGLDAVQTTFAVLYSLLLVYLNVNYVVPELQRYLIPVLPFLLLAVRPWWPQRRRWMVAAAVCSAVLAAASVIGFRNTIATIVGR